MSDPLPSNNHQQIDILLENITVVYSAPVERIRTLKEYAIRSLKNNNNNQKRTFKALDNISLEIKRGEIFGVIGRNGAGKSTLLKVISRVLIPSEGRVVTNGLVYPLLQLGAGFHPELTGRENVFLNGTLLGHTSAEIKERFDEIVDFSEIGGFINAPVRTYSSGMQARLGFAVASAWQPDILVLDEVLSVGDVAFQEKCLNRMRAFRESGTTTVLVTHSPSTLAEMCERAVLLDTGKIINLDAGIKIAEEYKQRMKV